MWCRTADDDRAAEACAGQDTDAGVVVCRLRYEVAVCAGRARAWRVAFFGWLDFVLDMPFKRL